MSVVDHGTPPEYAFAEHEHRELGRGVDNIHEVGRQVGNITSADLAAAIGGVLEWLNRVLAPHIAWEEAELYPRVDERATSPWATKMMRFEHYQIREAAERTGARSRALAEGGHT